MRLFVCLKQEEIMGNILFAPGEAIRARLHYGNAGGMVQA